MSEMKSVADITKKMSFNEDKEKEQKLIESLNQDPLIRKKLNDLGLNDDSVRRYLSFFLSYLDDAKECSSCKGLSSCPKLIKGGKMDLALLDGVLTRNFGACSLLVKEENVKKAFLWRDYPDEWLSLTPEGLGCKTARISSLIGSCQKALNDENYPWLFLNGEEGSGRSYIVASFCNWLALEGGSLAFMDANRRFDELKGASISDKTGFSEKMDKLSNLDLLVIDNFGSEYKSDYLRDQIVMPLLSSRSKKHLPTFFLSDYSLTDIETLYSTSRAGSIAAKSLVSLIKGNIEKPLFLERGFESFLNKRKGN